MNNPEPEKWILIVDDVEYYRQSLLGVVQSLGYYGLLAQDGPSAVKMVAGNREKLDLVLLDLSMPPSNDPQEGLKALRRIKKMAPDIPVVVMTSFMSLRKQSQRLGAQGFIEKDSLLLDQVRDLLVRQFGDVGASPTVESSPGQRLQECRS